MAGITPYTDESWRRTNADRIRAMTDLELAIWYCKFRDCLKCPHGKGCRVVGQGVLNWLEQEAER